MAVMNTEPKEPPSPELARCLQLTFAALAEPDEAKARVLIEQSGEAFIADVQARTGRRLAAAEALLEEAERALDAAEAAGDPAERARQMRLFELLLAAARPK
jgi:hypothetical protein